MSLDERPVVSKEDVRYTSTELAVNQCAVFLLKSHSANEAKGTGPARW